MLGDLKEGLKFMVRIADALERIADALEGKKPRSKKGSGSGRSG